MIVLMVQYQLYFVSQNCDGNGKHCTTFHVKDSSFLYMGRLLEGFGVGVISYTVWLVKFLLLATMVV